MRSSKIAVLSAALCLALSAFLCVGCKTDTEKLRGEGFSGEAHSMGSWAKTLRPKTPGVAPFTFDNRAREIEANLGVQ